MRGVESVAALPVFESEFREGAAQQRGYRMPVASDYEKGANSGLRLAVADPDATVAAPGVVTSGLGKSAGYGRSEAQENASPLGTVFATRFGGCALSSSDT